MCCLGLSRVYVGGESKRSFKILFRVGLVGLISHSCILFQTSPLLSYVILFVCYLLLQFFPSLVCLLATFESTNIDAKCRTYPSTLTV